ncbi:MAG: shikimate kinase [Lachnospiraceae bacterium]|nr:shikimate kinase [Lachnospiraceae bacterium]MCI7595415.1 shikimate kinase [Lachnospiraceae bacterium]MDD7049593.1 shikimate kinase [Lachnospiraceae bacterium]MDY3223092.1 shikimate kinase [Lachnospiraceae bacterium]
MSKSVTLIGMPGAGKSTVGVVLAKRLGYAFVDADLIIQQKEGRLLHQLIEERGLEGFLDIENRINASLSPQSAVIATGGSVVYGKEAMEHLVQTTTVIYLQLSLEALAQRLGDLRKRGVVLRKGQSLEELYEERVPLYRQYAHITIDCEKKDISGIVEEIAAILLH